MKLPNARSGRAWLTWFVLHGGILWIALLLWHYFYLPPGHSMDPVIVLRLGFTAGAVGAAAAAAGWLGARLAALLTGAGSAAGLLMLLRYSLAGDPGAWNDLAGLLSFLLLAFAGFAAGLLAEAALWLLRRRQPPR